MSVIVGHPEWAADVFPAGVGWSYIVKGPGGYCHQPSKLWRSKGMALAAARRALKRKIAEV